MKTKLFRKITASIISLSMLAATVIVPVTAQAATNLYTADFETETANYTTSLAGQSFERKLTNTAGNTTTFYNVYSSNAKGDRAQSFTLDNAYGAGVPVKFSMLMRMMGSNTNSSAFEIRDSAGANLFKIGATSYLGAVTINDESVSLKTAKLGSKLLGDSDYNASGWLKIEATIDFRTAPAMVDVKVSDTTNSDTVVYEKKYTTDAVNIKSFYANIGRSNGAFAYDDIVIDQLADDELSTVKNYTVKYVVDGSESEEIVEENKFPAEIPETEKAGFIFSGWAKDGDTLNLISTDALKTTAITADTVFTAQYTKDEAYIEPIVTAELIGADSMTIGADADTPAANEYSVKLTGEQGTIITADTLDSRIEDFSIAWDVAGFKTVNDTADNSYCDYYGEFESKVTKDVTAVFNLRKNASMNFYGLLTATITYNGETIKVSKPVVAISNTDIPSNQILPIAGYPSDIADYSDALNGYGLYEETNAKGSDLIAGGWVVAGSDTSRSAIITKDGDESYIRVNAPTMKKSHIITQTVATPKTQVIFEQVVRFNSAGGSILFTAGNPFWVDKKYFEAFALEYSDSTIKFNSTAITKDDQAVTVKASEWYKIVISADKTNETCFVKVYDAEGNFVGETPNVNWVTSCDPTYYSVGFGSGTYTGTIDLASYKAYYPVADESTYSLTSTADTLSIPNGDTAELNASLKTVDGYDITGLATWTVLEDDMKNGVVVTPDATDSHKAVVSLADGASAGEATIEVNIGGYAKSVKLNITDSAESIKFTESQTSISIPLDASKSVTAKYAAMIIDGEGNNLGRDITYTVYDKTNSNAITLPDGIVFNTETGILTVSSSARAYTFVIRATGKNSDGNELSKAVKVTVHGLAFDFGAGTDEDLADGYTAVTAQTAYSAQTGYGISGTVTEGGTASTTNAEADYLEGDLTFKANVEKAKYYTVEITYQGKLTAEPVNGDLTAYTLGSQETLATASYTVPVIDDVLELNIAKTDTATAQIASIVITKEADREANEKPTLFVIGDSTLSNGGSWGYYITHNTSSFGELYDTVDFNMRGRGGSNLMKYYTSGDFVSVLRSIKPGDVVSLGNMGTNGMGSTFEEDFNYYLDAFEALGAKIMIHSYSPHGAVGNYAYCYNRETQTFSGKRTDSYDNIVRAIAQEREANDKNYIGFVDIGQRADDAFNAYVDDYAANGYESRDAAAQAIIACYPDHNHSSGGNLAPQLMTLGYGNVEGAVAGFVDIISAYINGSEEEKAVEITSFTASQTKAEVTVSVAEESANDLYVGIYNGNGELIKVTKTEAVSDTFTFEGDYSSAAYAKAFLWENGTMTPVAECDKMNVPA